KESQIIKLDVAPYINNDIDPNPLPFNIEQEQYIFGGGALYKTLGDKEHKYYQIIDKLLEINKQVKFLYAGSGDSSQMEVLIKKYPERVFLIEERSDFYKLISNSVFLLNTYPFAGGLMTRYAALAGKIPLTLKHGEDQVFLENQDKLGIEYDDCDDLIEEGIKLISNPQYRENKEEQLRNSVIDEDKFSRNIKILLATNRTEYSFDKIEDVNTDKFRAEYKDRFTKQKMASIICGRKYRKLFWYFPGQFISGAIQKLLRNGKEI
ncbi:MAG: hypothetical protein MSH32_04615, partial [Lachnospiraceae bacterium]|nr:hypothetical protein [Lachnospiraceae bacterium]